MNTIIISTQMKSILFLAMLSLSTMLIAKPLAEVVDEKEGYFTAVSYTHLDVYKRQPFFRFRIWY